jgi:oleandomycin transport system ATP-binding protein
MERSDIAAVVAVLSEVAPGQTPGVTPSGELILPGADAALLSAVANRLDAAGITVAELGLRLPSLDDVFLGLTGHTAEEVAA